MKNVEEAIEFIRKQKGISIRGLAIQTGIGYPNLHRILSGKAKPKVETIKRISEKLGVPAEAIYALASESVDKGSPYYESLREFKTKIYEILATN